MLVECISIARSGLIRPMTRTIYRKKIEKMFGILTADVDVCHIISKKNGGADHPDNYDYVRGRTWNRMTGHKYDDVNCFLAGKEACQKAVDISIELNDYSGPGASELYESGERIMKHAFKILSTERT